MTSEDGIECPYCGHTHDFEDYLDVGDMSGDFEMDCEKCGENFKVDFYSVYHFITTK